MEKFKTYNRIREHRERFGISQSELGRRIGFSEAAINRYENGARKPSHKTMQEIAEVLGVQLRDLYIDLTTTTATTGIGVAKDGRA